MNEIVGNFWDVYKNYDAIVVTTNGILKQDGSLVMGAGIAKDFAIKFPDVPASFGRLVKKYGNRCYILLAHSPAIISFPTKHHWKDPSDPDLIKSSAELLSTLVEVNNFKKALLPRPGCGMGGLSWSDVKPVLSEFLDERFDIITQ